MTVFLILAKSKNKYGRISLNRTRLFIGVLYRTFASWQHFGDKGDRGSTAAGMIGVLLAFLTGSALYFLRPELVRNLLALPPILRLLVPTLFVLLTGSFFQAGDRGWRWAAAAEKEAPKMVAHGTVCAVGAICFVVGVLAWSAWWSHHR
jgi:hypothetical protein